MPEETPQGLTTRFELEPLDTIRAYQLHYRDQLWRKASVISLAVLLVLETVVLAVALPGEWLAVALIVTFSAVGGFVAPRLMIRYRIPRAARKIHGQQKALQQPVEVEFAANGLRTTAPAGTSLTPWPHYRKMREDQHVMLFYQSDALFQFVPKRALPGSQADEVRWLFEAGRV